MPDTFNALVVEETSDGDYNRSIQERSTNQLPNHDVLIEVHYSALNYKDAHFG